MASSKILVALVSGAAIAVLSACGDGSSNPSSGVGPEVQKETLKDDQAKGDRKGKDGSTPKDGRVVVDQDGKKDGGAVVIDLDLECKKATILEQFKKDCDARKGTPVVIPGQGQGQGQGHVVDVKGGKMALLKILRGQWAYQGEACLPTQDQFTLDYAQGLSQWQQVVQGPGQGQGGVTVAQKRIVIVVRAEDDVDVIKDDVAQFQRVPLKFGPIQRISADQNQGQAQIQLPHQQAQQDTLIVKQADKAVFYVTEQNDACQDTGKVIQKFTK